VEHQAPSGNSSQGEHEAGTLESSWQALWDRVRLAAETITRLREENRVLRGRVSDLERQLQQAAREFRDVQEQLKTQSRQAPQPQPVSPFVNGEREALVARVKEVLAKLDAYL
jgi:chromosome segregation ATPase